MQNDHQLRKQADLVMAEMYKFAKLSDEIDKTASLSDDAKKRAAYALNMCTVSVSQIVDYADIQVLEQEYEAILNNLNLEQIPKDEALLQILRQLLDTITYFRIQEGDKAMLEKQYQQKMKNAIWSAVPNFGTILASGNPLAIAVSLATQVGTGYMNYRRTKAENMLEKENQMWQLQRGAIEQFNGLRRELFNTAWRLADSYAFDDAYRLTERQIEQYNRILMDPDDLRRYERLESVQDKFEAYPPFWYYMGHAANLIANDSSFSADNREEFRQKAQEHFDRYEDVNRFNILREDQMAATCALEYVDLLLCQQNYDKSDLCKRIEYAAGMCGNANDILELCAIAYLRIGEADRAAKLLKILVNEDYNRIVNAQLLSSIYVHNQDRKKYERLERFVDKRYLFPMPTKDKRSIAELEDGFCKSQRSALKEKAKCVLDAFRTQGLIRWNRVLSTFDTSNPYEDSFFLDTAPAIDNRLREAKIILTDPFKSDSYHLAISGQGYELQILDILNAFCSALTTLPMLSDEAFCTDFTASVRAAIVQHKDHFNETAGLIGEKKLTPEEYEKACAITFDDIVGEAMELAFEKAEDKIDHASIPDLSVMESDLRAFCQKNGLKEPEVILSEVENVEDAALQTGEFFGPELFGHRAIMEKENADFLKNMASYVQENMSKIPLQNDEVSVYYRDSKEFGSYFYNVAFSKFGDLKPHCVMILHDETKKCVDLLFTTQGIVTVSKNRVVSLTPYADVQSKGKSLKLYRKEYQTTALDLNLLYTLIRSLGSNFVRSVKEYVERVDSNLLPSNLKKWFEETKQQHDDAALQCVIAFPDKETLAGLQYYFSDEVDPQTHLLQFCYDQTTRDVVRMRIVEFDAWPAALKQELQNRNGIIVLS